MQNQTIWAHIVIFFYLEEFLKATKITLEIILQLVLEKLSSKFVPQMSDLSRCENIINYNVFLHEGHPLSSDSPFHVHSR